MSAISDATWVAELRRFAAKHSQPIAGKKIGYSPAVVNQVLKGTYEGNLSRVQEAVEGALMGSLVECPVIGGIPRNACIAHQRRAGSPQATNPMRIALAQTCPSCEHATQIKSGAAGKE